MPSERPYKWRLNRGTVNPDLYSSYDLSCWGYEFLIMKIKVYQVTCDNISRQVLNQRVENSYWESVPCSRLQPDDDHNASSFFSGILSAKQIPEDENMIDEMLSLARAISVTSGSRKNLLFSPIPSMSVHVFFYSPSSLEESSSSTLNRALEESMRANRFNPVAASKSSIEALEKTVIVDVSSSVDGCVICLEKFNVGLEVVTRMPCFHVYHGDCIVRWLQISHFCPLCRFPMPT